MFLGSHLEGACLEAVRFYKVMQAQIVVLDNDNRELAWQIVFES